MDGPADQWSWGVYSAAMTKCAEGSRRGPISAGWQSLSIGLPDLANGLYYVVLTAARDNGRQSSRRVLKMLVLR
jgi:hypothetical protein